MTRLQLTRSIEPEMIRVYVASAYTKGDVAVNVRASIDAADELINEGFIPFCPLLTHFHHMIHPHDYETWMMLDLEWLSACNYLLRLPGESSGADYEVEYARSVGIPVFYTIEQLKEYIHDEE